MDQRVPIYGVICIKRSWPYTLTPKGSSIRHNDRDKGTHDSQPKDGAKGKGPGLGNQEKFLEEEQQRIGRLGEDPRRPGRALSQPRAGDEGGAGGSSGTPGSDQEEETGYWESVNDIREQVPTLTEDILNETVAGW